MKKRVVFICGRNLPRDPGQARLVSRRADYLLSLDVDVKVFFLFRHQGPEGNHLGDHFVPLKVMGLRDLCKSVRSLMGYLTSCPKDETVIVFSGPKVYPLACFLAWVFSGIQYLMDKDAVLEEILEYPSNGTSRASKMQVLLYRFLKILESHLLSGSTGVLTVSSEMSRYVRPSIGESVPTYQIPCTHSASEVMEPEMMLKTRDEYRSRYGISPSERVLVYSGSLSSWQCFEESCNLVLSLRRMGYAIRFLVLTGQLSQAADIALSTGLPEDALIVMTVTPDEVAAVQTMGDVGLLIRKPCLTNRVAWPNKLSEYTLSGLLIVHTGAVPAVHEVLAGQGLGFVLDGVSPGSHCLRQLEALIRERDSSLSDYYRRAAATARAMSIDQYMRELRDYLSLEKAGDLT